MAWKLLQFFDNTVQLERKRGMRNFIVVGLVLLNKNPKDRWGVPISRTALLIILVGFLIFCQRVQAVELTLLYSNDMRGIIDPCPT